MELIRNIYRLLFAHAGFQKFNRALFQLSLHGLGVLNYRNGRASGEEHLVRRLLPKLVRSESPVFFDVGANVGDFSSSLLATFPSAVVHAFEPHPTNFRRLNSRAFAGGRLKCHNMALGDKADRATLYDRADSDGSSHASLYAAVITEIHRQNVVSVDVQTNTLDAIAAQEGVHFIDFLKIDTEGNELAVLLGATQLLQRDCIGCIQFEFNEMNVASRVFFRDIRRLLSNYDLFRMLPRGLLALGDDPLSTELFAYQNILAIRKCARADARGAGK